MLRNITIVCLFLLAGMAMAAVTSWQEAYHLDADYRQTERAVTTANDDLTKLQADPGAAPLDVTRAQETLASAQAKQRQAGTAALVKALTAVGDVLVDRDKLAAAKTRLELAKLQLQVAELRQQAGVISTQELARAQDACAQAEATQAVAIRDLAGAETRVKIFVDVAPDSLPDPPIVDTANVTLGDHPQLLTARFAVNEAARALALAKGPDTPPLELAAKERALQNAQDAMTDVERTLKDALDTARHRYATAREAYTLAQNGLALAVKDDETTATRQKSGAISRVALTQANAARLDAITALAQAQMELWQARLGLLNASGGAL